VVIVVEKNKIVGICAINDFFRVIVNPLLGIGERGSRIIVISGGDGKPAEDIISTVNKSGKVIKSIWGITSPTIRKNNLVLYLDTKDPTGIIETLKKKKYYARIVQR
jgi:acetoin utilization protein AcuB